MYAKSKAKSGVKVNACPFGCEDHYLDENGYCVHLVGFTNDGPKAKFMEPMIMGPHGKRVVRVPQVVDTDKSIEGEVPVMKSQLVPIPEGALLVQITTSHRVYAKALPKPTLKNK